MYNIEKQTYGYKLTFSGQVLKTEMENWVQDAKKILSGQPVGKFGVFVDMCELKPLDPETSAVMVKGQAAFKEKGLERSVVILNNPIIAMQFRRLAKESGIYQWERYLDNKTVKDYEQVGLAWINNGIDPDKK